jgi:hypothetical protein
MQERVQGDPRGRTRRVPRPPHQAQCQFFTLGQASARESFNPWQ